MKRRLLNLVVGASLFLCIATVALWILSGIESPHIDITRGRFVWSFTAARGALHISREESFFRIDGRRVDDQRPLEVHFDASFRFVDFDGFVEDGADSRGYHA